MTGGDLPSAVRHHLTRPAALAAVAAALLIAPIVAAIVDPGPATRTHLLVAGRVAPSWEPRSHRLAVVYTHPVTGQQVETETWVDDSRLLPHDVGEPVWLDVSPVDPSTAFLAGDGTDRWEGAYAFTVFFVFWLTFGFLYLQWAAALAVAGPIVLGVWQYRRLAAHRRLVGDPHTPTFAMLGALRPGRWSRHARLDLWPLDAAPGAPSQCHVRVRSTAGVPFGPVVAVQVKGAPRAWGRVVAACDGNVLWPAGTARVGGRPRPAVAAPDLRRTRPVRVDAPPGAVGGTVDPADRPSRRGSWPRSTVAPVPTAVAAVALAVAAAAALGGPGPDETGPGDTGALLAVRVDGEPVDGRLPVTIVEATGPLAAQVVTRGDDLDDTDGPLVGDTLTVPASSSSAPPVGRIHLATLASDGSLRLADGEIDPLGGRGVLVGFTMPIGVGAAVVAQRRTARRLAARRMARTGLWRPARLVPAPGQASMALVVCGGTHPRGAIDLPRRLARHVGGRRSTSVWVAGELEPGGAIAVAFDTAADPAAMVCTTMQAVPAGRRTRRFPSSAVASRLGRHASTTTTSPSMP